MAREPRRRAARRTGERGQVLAGVILLVMVLLVIIPALVEWVQNDMKASVNDRKSTVAFNLASAGIDRAYWKLKGSTTTWANALDGVPLSGYDFDQIYKDVSGGEYRISISSGPLSQEVTVIAEGRDSNSLQYRAIEAVYANQTIPGAIISGAGIGETGGAVVHWGPMLAMNDITLSGSAKTNGFPRKMSKQVVLPFDTNGLNPPNTDNLEWWSDYDVPELPVFDFAALRSSAAATDTLNCDGNVTGTHTNHVSCGSSCTNCSVQNMYKDKDYNKGYVWYWDNNVSWSGRNGVKGTVIVRGNLSVSGGDYYVPAAMNVPANAWQEYQKIDTSASNQYPGDTGLHSNAATYTLGSCGMTCEGGAGGGDLGVDGFLYVGGTLSMTGDSDIHGAAWVEQGWSGAGNVMIFYDDSLVLPQLNVTLYRKSWKEIPPP
jgi:hypothetical protein